MKLIKVSLIIILQLIILVKAVNAQLIPAKYTTNQTLEAIMERSSFVFEDSLQYPQCEIYTDENFLKRRNRQDTGRYHYNKDGSLVVVKSTNRFSQEERISILDPSLELKLLLSNPEEKQGKLLQLNDEHWVSKFDYQWQPTGKHEIIAGVTTEIYQGHLETRRGTTKVTAWKAKSFTLPSILRQQLPPTDGLDGVVMKYKKIEIEQCLQSTITVQLQNLVSEDKTFNIEAWTFKDQFNNPFGSRYSSASGSFNSEESTEQSFLSDEETSWKPTTWEEELNKFKQVTAKKPESKATIREINNDSLRYLSPFPIEGKASASIQMQFPKSWQVTNEYVSNGTPVIWLSNVTVDNIAEKPMEAYEIWKNDQVILRVTKVEPDQELNNMDGHYDDSSDVWGEKDVLYQHALRYFENNKGRTLKMERCLIQCTRDEDQDYHDNYLVEGFVHASEDNGLVHQFVKQFIQLNDL